MSRLDVFVAPRPNRALIGVMSVVNRIVMLKGVPGLRDLWPFNRVAGFRGIANVRHLDFPDQDRTRLASVLGPGKATFLAPNHPEFFTDWMIDKEITSKLCPLAACWATNGVVNGLGGLAQRFWLANNLIAQIPGNSDAAREHSIAWAVRGHGVLLHPEGGVGWHGNFVAPLLPGAVEMAIEALARGRSIDPAFEAWVAPIVWKLAFLHDVGPALAKECAYVERSLRIGAPPQGMPVSERVFRIYDVLLSRDEAELGLTGSTAGDFAARQAAVCAVLRQRIRAIVDPAGEETDDVLRRARRWLRENPARSESSKVVKAAMETVTRVKRLGAFAFEPERLTQEEVAEHIKRIRNDYCKGTLRDTLNRFVPQPAGPRRAHIRVPEPIALHAFEGSAADALEQVRRRLQDALDTINRDISARSTLPTYPNPFRQ